MKQRVLIFGATGGTGQHLVKQALAQDFSVTAFVREPSKVTIQHERLKVEKGDVLNYRNVKKAMNNQDIVICALGAPTNDKSMLRARGAKNILQAMDEKSVSRFICLSSLGFGDSKDLLPWHMKYMIVPFVLKHVFADHEQQEKIIKQSKVSWTIIRPGKLTDGEKIGKYKHGFSFNDQSFKMNDISKADVAEFMLRQINDSTYLNKVVGISN